MKTNIVRAIILEEKQGYLSVRFTPNPKEYPIKTRSDAIHSAIYDKVVEILKEYESSEDWKLSLEVD